MRGSSPDEVFEPYACSGAQESPSRSRLQDAGSAGEGRRRRQFMVGDQWWLAVAVAQDCDVVAAVEGNPIEPDLAWSYLNTELSA